MLLGSLAVALVGFVMANLVTYVPQVELKAIAIGTVVQIPAVLLAGIGYRVLPKKRPAVAVLIVLLVCCSLALSVRTLHRAGDSFIARQSRSANHE